MAHQIESMEVQTAATPVQYGPVRLYTTGSNYGRVVLATGGEDRDVIGIALAAPQTQGMACPVAISDGYEFQGSVNTTVSVGDKLKAGPGGVFQAADSVTPTTAQDEPRFCARVLKARTDTGVTWLAFERGGLV